MGSSLAVCSVPTRKFCEESQCRAPFGATASSLSIRTWPLAGGSVSTSRIVRLGMGIVFSSCFSRHLAYLSSSSFLQILTFGSFSDWVDIKILPSRQAGFPVTVCSAASFSLRGCRVPSKALFTAKQLTLFGSFPNCSFKASRLSVSFCFK